MHEFSICQELVKVALAEVEKHGPSARLRKARLAAGALRQIVPEAMTFAFEVLTKDTLAEGAVLEIVNAPVVAKCRQCGWQGEIEEMVFQCAACGGIALDLQGGTELYLESLEVGKDESA